MGASNRVSSGAGTVTGSGIGFGILQHLKEVKFLLNFSFLHKVVKVIH